MRLANGSAHKGKRDLLERDEAIVSRAGNRKRDVDESAPMMASGSAPSGYSLVVKPQPSKLPTCTEIRHS